MQTKFLLKIHVLGCFQNIWCLLGQLLIVMYLLVQHIPRLCCLGVGNVNTNINIGLGSCFPWQMKAAWHCGATRYKLSTDAVNTVADVRINFKDELNF